MFTKSGMMELHATTHERLDLLLRHIATVPDELTRKPVAGFGHASIWKQLVHILTCEEGWVHDLRNKAFDGWQEEDCPTMAALLAASRLRVERSKNSITGLSSKDGELETSTTVSAPSIAPASPSRVMVLTPVLGDAASTSWPRSRRLFTSLLPIRPLHLRARN